VYSCIFGITVYSFGVALVARLTGFEPFYYYLLVSLLAGAFASVLASAFMTEKFVGTLPGLAISIAVILVLMLFSPPTGRIVYPLDGDSINSQRVYISGTAMGVHGKQFLSVCVLTPGDPSGHKHPCWSTRTRGTLFETRIAIYIGTKEEDGIHYTVELRATEKQFSDFSEEMKPSEEGRLLDHIDVVRRPEAQSAPVHQ